MSVSATPTTAAAPLPSAGTTDLMPVLQQLTQALSALVNALQAQSGSAAGAGAAALGGGPGAGQAPGQGPGSGCGCGGASGAVAGAGSVGQESLGANGAPEAAPSKGTGKGKAPSPGDEYSKGGGANGAPEAAGAAGGGSEKGVQLVAEVRKHLGTKYVWGGEDPSGFDCSGLMQYVAKKLGIDLPRTAAEQAKAGKQVSKDELQPGDMVFFNTSGGISHVGMYIGDGRMIHAPKTGDVVKVASIDDSYYSSRFVTARRMS